MFLPCIKTTLSNRTSNQFFSIHIVLFSTTVHIARCENFLFEERYILEKTIGNRVTVTAGERIEILLEAVGTGP